MKKIKLMHCGHIGSYDGYNPIYVESIEYVPEILYIMAKGDAFELARGDIADKLSIDIEKCNKALDALKKIDAISEENNKFKVNFTIFLEDDVIALQRTNRELSKDLGKKVIELEDKILEKMKELKYFDESLVDVFLYHVVACNVLDWHGLDYFEKMGILTQAKEQPGDRHYIMIGYEESAKVEEYSHKLYCSSNNIFGENIRFSSFGDYEGLRMKGMRGVLTHYKRTLIHNSKHENVGQAYNELIDNYNRKLIEDLGEILLNVTNNEVTYDSFNDEDKLKLNFLEAIEYIQYTDKSSPIEVKIPIFEKSDNEIIDKISELILSHIREGVESAFKYIYENLTQITPVRHRVDIKDMSNEIWHQIFGEMIECLMEEKFIPRPPYIEGEGHYFKTMYVD